MPLQIERRHTRAGEDVFASVGWETRTAEIGPFRQEGVEFPSAWSQNATNIVADKYFRGKGEEREYSVRQMISRVADWYATLAVFQGYIDPQDVEGRLIFRDELIHLVLHQRGTWNSPVWFNVGRTGDKPPRVSACFTLSVENSMRSILQWYVDEGMVFKAGSGAGVNLSPLQEEGLPLRDGGVASGPVSFMRGADASAGTIKSGGAARRAAKLVVLNDDHPDIEQFIDCKVYAEKMAKALKAAGFEVGLGGKDNWMLEYQNANNSVGCSNNFLLAVEDDIPWNLLSRVDGHITKVVRARDLFRKIAQAAWECACPGVFFLGNMNRWHTSPETGALQVANPCAEFVRNDSSCNLASLRLTKYWDDETGTFNAQAFVADVELLITAMDVSISAAEYPNDKIRASVERYRELGLGYADLGALLMRMGLPYDSDAGRAWAATITALMSGAAWKRSAELAKEMGPYPGWENQKNRDAHQRVMLQHWQALGDIGKDHIPLELWQLACDLWAEAITMGTQWGYRNAQVSLLAPTGTISFMMDCDTTGIEPDFALVKTKKLAGGGSMSIVNQCVGPALKRLCYTDFAIEQVVSGLSAGESISELVNDEDIPVFACAVGENAIDWRGHLKMVAAVQPFLSGSVSKTINMPTSATVEDIEEAIMLGWKSGLKAISVYRDGCKQDQPLNAAQKPQEGVIANVTKEEWNAGVLVMPVGAKLEPWPDGRQKLPRVRRGKCYSFHLADCEGYLHTGEYEDGSLGEVFLTVSKQGSTLRGLLDGFAIATSLALQHGTPLKILVQKFVGQSFPPQGVTNDPDLTLASSLLDLVFRRLAVDYLPPEDRMVLNVLTRGERVEEVGNYDNPSKEPPREATVVQDAPLCPVCGVFMRRAGSCFVCGDCGRTSGCS